MKKTFIRLITIGVVAVAALGSGASYGNSYREKGKVFEIADSSMTVSPSRDWNRLSIKPGKFAEVWTLDGEQLNDVTFYGGVEMNKSLVKERDKKRDPLPKFTQTMLLVDVPDLLEGTYRAYKQIGVFKLTNSAPGKFLGRDGVRFSYEYTDQDELPRKGEARAVIVNKKLFMVTFDAPRLHYFEKTVGDFRNLADAASLP